MRCLNVELYKRYVTYALAFSKMVSRHLFQMSHKNVESGMIFYCLCGRRGVRGGYLAYLAYTCALTAKFIDFEYPPKIKNKIPTRLPST